MVFVQENPNGHVTTRPFVKFPTTNANAEKYKAMKNKKPKSFLAENLSAVPSSDISGTPAPTLPQPSLQLAMNRLHRP